MLCIPVQFSEANEIFFWISFFPNSSALGHEAWMKYTHKKCQKEIHKRLKAESTKIHTHTAEEKKMLTFN